MCGGLHTRPNVLYPIVPGVDIGGGFLACLCCRISNQRLWPAPLPTGLPVNCVRQRELSSIDPHSLGLSPGDKGHSQVETNAGVELPGGGLPSVMDQSPVPFSCSDCIIRTGEVSPAREKCKWRNEAAQALDGWIGHWDSTEGNQCILFIGMVYLYLFPDLGKYLNLL